MKTAVLIHGCHRDVAGWEEIIWGSPKDARLGRVPKGILEAIRHEAAVVVFGSGLHYEDGVIESHYIYDYTLARLDDLATLSGMSAAALRAWLEVRIDLDGISSKTDEESRYALHVAHEKGVEQFILVSSPWHVLRCMKMAIMEADARPELSALRQHHYAAVSDADAPGLHVADVMIFEPHHRPDRPAVFFNETLKGIIPFMVTQKEDIAHAFNDALAALIAEWREKL